MESSNRPNIWLIMADQFRGDCLGIAGHPDVQTPYLDTLAANGVRFENAVSACPTCIPARAAALTGMSQEKNGRVGYQDGVDWNYPHTLAGELTRAGYQTRCVGKMHVHPLRSNQGFEEVELHDGYLHYYRDPSLPAYESQFLADDYMHWLKTELGAEADIIDTGMECNSLVSRPWCYEEKYHPTNWVAARSIDFFRKRDRTRPFFLMSSFVRPHPPFDAPSCYFDLYRNRALRPPYTADWDDASRLLHGGRIAGSVTGFSDPELQRQSQIGYYACITQLDHQIGRIYQTLEEQKLYDNTLIVFVSDHGEMLSDHHFARKSLPYNGSMRVPLIVSGGAVNPEVRGTTRDFVAELRDLMPTLLQSAGAPIPDSVDGVSLWGEIRSPGSEKREFIHGEHNGGFPNHFIVTKEDKYIWFADTGKEQYFRNEDYEEKFDRIADPAYAERIAYLRRLLIEQLTGRPEGFTDGKNLIPGRPYGALIPWK